MKILNISTIIPLVGLKRENDIILIVQDYLSNQYSYEFIVAKSLPFVNKYLAKYSKKWELYYEYQQNRIIINNGYKTFIYSRLAPPSSNFWLNYILLPFNWVWFKLTNQKNLSEFSKDTVLILAQNIIPDAVYAYWMHREYGKPYIINLRGQVTKLIRYLPVLRSILNNASSIVTHSPTNYSLFKNYFSLGLIPHPVDDQFFMSSKKDFKKIKIISVCRLLPLKHINWVIEVLANLQAKGYDFEYTVVGDGPELEKLKRLADVKLLTDKVNFKGYISHSEVHHILKKSHIFIMPSYPETLGRSFLEAAASDCLCIGHEKTGVDGLLKHNISAIFVNRRTINYELERVIKNFTPEYISQYTANARIIVDELSWQKIGKKYNNIFSKAIENEE